MKRLLALTALLLAVAAPAEASITWAPSSSATIRPGARTVTDGSQCTSNFVFTDGRDVFLGQAAHCSGTGSAAETDGCDAEVLPNGTPVKIEGASRQGTVVYNSWVAMQSRGERDENVCAYNDFALVRIDPEDHWRVNPSVPFWGGPAGVATSASPLSDVYGYGNSQLWLGADPLQPKQGVNLGPTGGGWAYNVYTASPGVPGDSGSGYLDADGKALGVLSTLEVLPLAGSNNVIDLARALDYMRASGGPWVELASGTDPFAPPTRVPLAEPQAQYSGCPASGGVQLCVNYG